MSLVTVQAVENSLVAAITRQAIDELGLTQGDAVTVLIKATEVMLLK